MDLYERARVYFLDNFSELILYNNMIEFLDTMCSIIQEVSRGNSGKEKLEACKKLIVLVLRTMSEKKISLPFDPQTIVDAFDSGQIDSLISSVIDIWHHTKKIYNFCCIKSTSNTLEKRRRARKRGTYI